MGARMTETQTAEYVRSISGAVLDLDGEFNSPPSPPSRPTRTRREAGSVLHRPRRPVACTEMQWSRRLLRSGDPLAVGPCYLPLSDA